MTAKMQFRSDGFVTITNIGGVVGVSAPTWRAKRWGVKTLRREAALLGISLKKQNGAWYADQKKMRELEYPLFTALKKCWVSPKVRDMRGEILDRGF